MSRTVASFPKLAQPPGGEKRERRGESGAVEGEVFVCLQRWRNEPNHADHQEILGDNSDDATCLFVGFVRLKYADIIVGHQWEG